jgi:hypothetical protein
MAARIVTAVIRQPTARGRQPHPTTVGFDQSCAGGARQRRDLLGHRRRREVVRVGDRAHRPEPRQRQQQLKAPRVHIGNCSGFVNGMST